MHGSVEAIVHPVLGVGAVAVPELDVGAVIRVALAQVQAFTVIQRGVDRAIRGVKVPLLIVVAMAIIRLDIRTVIRVAAIVVNAFSGVISKSDPAIEQGIAELIQDETILRVKSRGIFDCNHILDGHLLDIHVAAAATADMVILGAAAPRITTTGTAGIVGVTTTAKSKCAIKIIRIIIIVSITGQ